MAKIVFLLSCLLAFTAPFYFSERPQINSAHTTTTFPTEFEGRKLQDLGLSAREQYFLQDFPGQIGRFTDGSREIIIRRVTEPTRKLHPASDCFRAVGYSVVPLPLKIDDRNNRWACFSASRNDDHLRICERIHDENGNEWSDVSSWYWSTFGTTGQWWAITVAEREPDS